jgi:hypothetical protein
VTTRKRTTGKRPSYFSPVGIAAGAVLVVVVVALTVALGPVLFSPGSLNAQARTAPLGGVASHAQLGNRCGACHTAPWSSQTMADKCLGCHADVAGQVSGKTGLHGTLAAMRSAPCGDCHPDHNGANGALTSLDESSFPHDVTGFSLSGHREKAKGGRFTCADCHPNGYAKFDQSICATCHEALDASFMTKHETAFGKDCLPCHDGSGNAKVDHSKFPFKLTGKHASVPCNGCHGNAKSMQDFQKTPQDCYSCHAKDDEHKGSFGKDCGSCHTTNGWAGATFDHTVFPVDHGTEKQASSCQTCHPNGTSTYTCFGCHAHTQANVVGQHEGKSLSQLTDCIKCHAGGKSGGD